MTSLWDEAKNLERIERRLDRVEVMMLGYADALIEIAARFGGPAADRWCLGCLRRMDVHCAPHCPGLLARRALGVA